MPKHEEVKCMNCDAELFSVYVREKDDGNRYKISSNCPYCGDVSFEPYVNGYSVDEKKFKILSVEEKEGEICLQITTTTQDS